MLLEIINQLLLELHSKVGVTINNYSLFLQVNGVNFISENFFVRFDTVSAISGH
jgi:hypothetical protein